MKDRCYDFAVPFEPKFIVDCGGNIGLASVFFKIKYPQAKIVALEPESSNYELLQRNVRPYSDVFPLKKGVWNKSTRLIIKDDTADNWAFQLDELPEGQSPPEGASVVDAVSVQSILDEYGTEWIDILKIDIEGGEYDVFQTNTETWLRKTRVIVIEFHDRLRAGCLEQFLKATSAMRFRKQSLHDVQGVSVYFNEDLI